MRRLVRVLACVAASLCAPALLGGAEPDEGLHPIDALLYELYLGEAKGPLRVAEPELNDWLATVAELPPGVRDLRIAIAPEGITARATVDAGAYKDQLPPSAAAAVSFIEGPLPVVLVMGMHSAGGQGLVEVSELSLGGVPFPTSMVPTIVAAFTRSASQPAGFDVTRPFPLPRDIERIRLGRGEAWLELRRRSSR